MVVLCLSIEYGIKRNIEVMEYRDGADLGEGGRGGRGGGVLGWTFLPLWYFEEIHFWPTDPEIFLKEPLAPIYSNFEGERAPKKRNFFLSKFFKNCPKTAFFELFFKILPAAQKI